MAKEKRIQDIEQEIRAFWERERIFEQSVEREAPNGEFVFYEGPPTANAPPGIHHVIGRTFKDVIPRYQTMRGKRVRRKAGWDTHGLPVELQVEKALRLKTKKDIEAYGIATFNAACRDSVWAFKAEWERLTERIGFWLDQRNPYVTYEMPYVESVWWFLRQAWEKGLLTRDYRSVWYCPRCQTPLSSHEVAQGYEEDVEDPSVYVKFEIRNSKLEKNPKLELSNDQKAYFLAWTTTPWTLPGNAALAVHPEVEYAVVRPPSRHLERSEAESRDLVILARPLVERVLGPDAEIVQTIHGSDLVGTRYEPLYSVRDSSLITHHPSLHAVLPADFVSLEDGTGIVHIAPAYGAEDFELGKAHGIPPLFTVHPNGVVMDDYPGAGKFFKAADADVRADLTRRGFLFRDETIRHTYPFCWRCDTPLLAYARASWYITMSKLRAEIQAKNATIHWLPEHIKDGRFGEWLRELKDWAITRERYWGAPMPVWQCTGQQGSRAAGQQDGCGYIEVLGSFVELIAKAPKRNRFILMRHGEARSNVEHFINSKLETSPQYPLTEAGRARVAAAAEQLKQAGVTIIIASPFHRMRQTAEIVSAAVGVPVTYDDRLREIDLPDFDGKPEIEFNGRFASAFEKFGTKIGANETWNELARRMLLALKDIDARHEGEVILICSHGDPLFLLRWAFSGRTKEGIDRMPYPTFDDPEAFSFVGALVNDRGELDVHRPFIDGITWSCGKECGGTMRRFPEVVDVWLESGCMPFAQVHWPFETAEQQNSRTAGGKTSGVDGKTPDVEERALLYPADYISEAIDQTRGWFYTLLAVATVLGWDAPYRNVICYSHILDREGKKMSKSKGNVVNPIQMIDRYGADVVRWYMVSVNQPWDAKLFNEADLKTMSNKPFGTLRNLLAFWELHGGTEEAWLLSKAFPWDPSSREHALDAWANARLHETRRVVTGHLDAYEVTEAARAIAVLIDDVSTWWLRRSRERLKSGDRTARSALATILRDIAILLAPFAPFSAEWIWRTLRDCGALGADVSESVHLVGWDDFVAEGDDGVFDQNILNDMAAVRRWCALGLEARAKVGIPVRQPLNALRLYASTPLRLSGAFLELVREEVNVKEVRLERADGELRVALDTTLTPELKREGMVRELTRAVNNLRKEMGLTPSDRIRVTYETADAELAQAIAEQQVQIERATVASQWNERGAGGETSDVDRKTPDVEPAPTGASREPAHHTLRIASTQITLDIAV